MGGGLGAMSTSYAIRISTLLWGLLGLGNFSSCYNFSLSSLLRGVVMR